MEKLEKIVNRYSSEIDENKPLIKKVDFPVANEVIIIPNDGGDDDYSEDGDDEFDEESGNPRTRRMKRCLKEQSITSKVLLVIACSGALAVGCFKLYNMYF
jgi:hypothetical protein